VPEADVPVNDSDCTPDPHEPPPGVWEIAEQSTGVHVLRLSDTSTYHAYATLYVETPVDRPFAGTITCADAFVTSILYSKEPPAVLCATTHRAYKVVLPANDCDDDTAYDVPVPSAAVFHPAKRYPVRARLPELAANVTAAPFTVTAD
jgi:hypothetical protein